MLDTLETEANFLENHHGTPPSSGVHTENPPCSEFPQHEATSILVPAQIFRPYPFSTPDPSIHGEGLFVASLPAKERAPFDSRSFIPIVPYWHSDCLKVGQLFKKNTVFFKQRKAGSISLIYERNLRDRGVHGYAFRLQAGEVSAADGVGFVFAGRVPCSKNVKRLWSIFMNRAGKISKRMGPVLVPWHGPQLPPLAINQTVSMVVDLNTYRATFQVSRGRNQVLGVAHVDFSDIAEKVDASRGYFCAALAKAGTVVELLLAGIEIMPPFDANWPHFTSDPKVPQQEIGDPTRPLESFSPHHEPKPSTFMANHRLGGGLDVGPAARPGLQKQTDNPFGFDDAALVNDSSLAFDPTISGYQCWPANGESALQRGARWTQPRHTGNFNESPQMRYKPHESTSDNHPFNKDPLGNHVFDESVRKPLSSFTPRSHLDLAFNAYSGLSPNFDGKFLTSHADARLLTEKEAPERQLGLTSSLGAMFLKNDALDVPASFELRAPFQQNFPRKEQYIGLDQRLGSDFFWPHVSGASEARQQAPTILDLWLAKSKASYPPIEPSNPGIGEPSLPTQPESCAQKNTDVFTQDQQRRQSICWEDLGDTYAWDFSDVRVSQDLDADSKDIPGVFTTPGPDLSIEDRTVSAPSIPGRIY